MGGPPTTKTPGSRATGDRGIGNRGIGNRGTGDRGTENRGTENRGTGNRGIAPAPPAPRYLASPDEVTFPDVIMGDVARTPVWIFNVHPSASSSLQIAIEVARDRPSDLPPFQVVSAPTRLRPSHEGAGEPVVVAFTSQRRAEYTGKLVVVASWGSSGDTQRIEIRLRGWTRAEGQPLRADVRAAEAARQAADRFARDQAAREAALQRRYEQETDKPYPPSKENELERQAERARGNLLALCDVQFAAILAVKEETARFKRRSRPPSHRFARGLARFAFDVATAGIAGRVASGVVQAFSKRVKYVRPEPVGELWNVHGAWRREWLPAAGPPKAVTVPALLTPQGMAALDEMVQATVRGTLKPVESGLAAAAPAPHAPDASDRHGADDAPVSSVGDIQFFYEQSEESATEKQNRWASLANLHAMLKPSLRREADAAIMAMRALAESLEKEKLNAGRTQASQTRQAWMSFLSQGSVGSLSPTELRRRGLRAIDDTVAVTDVAQIARSTVGGKAPPHDGVLDVYVRANRPRPLEAIKIERVHMNGVIDDLLRRCLEDAGLVAGRPISRFGDLRIALRAIVIAVGIEDFGVVVTRDEAGNVFSSDTTGALPQDSNWLARRAGHQKTSPLLQHEGAVHLMNEILRSEIVARGKMSTDGA